MARTFLSAQAIPALHALGQECPRHTASDSCGLMPESDVWRRNFEICPLSKACLYNHFLATNTIGDVPGMPASAEVSARVEC